MEFLYTAVTARIIFILGIINLITGGTIFFSCRCLPGSGIRNKLMKYRGYQRFYRYHCYIWMVFWPSVIIHAILAVLYFGYPG